MMEKGMKFVPGKVDEWMDCGNKDVTVETNSRMLGFLHNDGEHLVDLVPQQHPSKPHLYLCSMVELS